VPKGRRVRRVVRKIDTWTVLRLSFVFWLCVAVITLGAGVVVWTGARQLDLFTSISKFMESLGILNFRFHGTVILKASAVVAMVFVLLATAFSVLLAVLYNLISAMVGGIEFVVLEEELAGPRVSPAPVGRSRPMVEVAEVPAPADGAEPFTPGVALS
jgi:uncharacterized membrane protein YagU involved in acid resistance